MFLTFSIENYRSYRTSKTISLIPSSSRDLSDNHTNSSIEGISALKAAAIYGPNAAGKSNLLAAMNYMAAFIRSPLDPYEEASANNTCFALDPKMIEKPISLNVTFVAGNNIYNYLISVKKGIIIEERLVVHPGGGKAQEWFSREGLVYKFNETHLQGPKKRLAEFVSEKTSVLGVALAFGHTQLSEPAIWIHENLTDRSELSDMVNAIRARRLRNEGSTAQRCSSDVKFKKWVEDILQYADFGIGSVQIETSQEKHRRPVMSRSKEGSGYTRIMQDVVTERYDPLFVHPSIDNKNVLFEQAKESQGTRKLFSMLSPLYDILQHGNLALVDEFGSSLHPSLAMTLIKVFQDPKVNAKGAQIIFTTHNTNLLTSKLFRRDQIWFTDKNKNGESDLFSLVEVKESRGGEAYERAYLGGRYGAVPFFGKLDFPETPEEEEEPGD
ncbi:MAG TPA: AAA family ATPase [Fimbriiglobus sp.]